MASWVTFFVYAPKNSEQWLINLMISGVGWRVTRWMNANNALVPKLCPGDPLGAGAPEARRFHAFARQRLSLARQRRMQSLTITRTPCDGKSCRWRSCQPWRRIACLPQSGQPPHPSPSAKIYPVALDPFRFQNTPAKAARKFKSAERPIKSVTENEAEPIQWIFSIEVAKDKSLIPFNSIGFLTPKWLPTTANSAGQIFATVAPLAVIPKISNLRRKLAQYRSGQARSAVIE
jgi:hypothetical protein